MHCRAFIIERHWRAVIREQALQSSYYRIGIAEHLLKTMHCRAFIRQHALQLQCRHCKAGIRETDIRKQVLQSRHKRTCTAGWERVGKSAWSKKWLIPPFSQIIIQGTFVSRWWCVGEHSGAIEPWPAAWFGLGPLSWMAVWISQISAPPPHPLLMAYQEKCHESRGQFSLALIKETVWA